MLLKCLNNFQLNRENAPLISLWCLGCFISTELKGYFSLLLLVKKKVSCAEYLQVIEIIKMQSMREENNKTSR